MAFDMQSGNLDYFQLEQTDLQIFADGAELNFMKALAQENFIKGFTTNPSLMHKAGVSTYSEFSKKVLANVQGKPVSFEVFSDEPEVMVEQALILRAWGSNVVVKIPITNTQGVFSGPIIQKLQAMGVPLNITAVFTTEQVDALLKYLDPEQPIIISVFAGRIADTGRDPLIMMGAIRHSLIQNAPKAQLLWASCREVYNILQADQCGCQIITVTYDILKKLPLLGKDLSAYSLDTVRAFYDDAKAAGINLSALSEGGPEKQKMARRSGK
jgi:transaldolase